MKFVCSKMKWEYNREDKSKRRVCYCDNPCTTSSCGRTIYVYLEKNLRAYSGVERGSKEWDDTYKIRVNVEKSINHFKDSFCVANRKTANEKTLHADLLLAGISQLLTVVVADKMNQRQYINCCFAASSTAGKDTKAFGLSQIIQSEQSLFIFGSVYQEFFINGLNSRPYLVK